MKISPLVTIIVPIYNAASHLPNCIDSIRNQTYPYLQILLIDDGSTDDSLAVCELFAASDKRITVLHQENAGASHARNLGLSHANGAFIQFVDADDYLDIDMTETLVDAMDKSTDLVICGYRNIAIAANKFYTKTRVPHIAGSYPKKDFMAHIGALYKDILLPSPCNKLYRNNIIQEHRLKFQGHLDLGEDLLFNLAYIHQCERVQVIPQVLYNYTAVRDNSLSRRFKRHYLSNQQMLYQQVKYFLLANQAYKGANKQYLHMIHATGIVNAINNLFHPHSTLTAREKKHAIAEIMRDEEVKQTIDYFNEGMQEKLVGSMLKMRFLYGLYSFFKTKQLLKRQMAPVFAMLKKIQAR